ncbi:hypothetical protein H0H92_002680 [Tricholoma furcatifolium]|nr:hypothetical protein H0H92_002680 [Tricholoma furcatifolium]
MFGGAFARRSILHRHFLAPHRRFSNESVKRAVAASKVLHFGKRAIKVSVYASVALVATTVAGFEGVHLWIEKMELAPDHDPEVIRWEWDQEGEKWSGDLVKGGTDPALGHTGRHRVRAAWASYNWGTDSDAAAAAAPDNGRNADHTGPENLKLVDTNMSLTASFLSGALHVANERASHGDMHPDTISQLLVRRAIALERLGGEAVQQAKVDFEHAWDGLSSFDITAATIASRLGEISYRLGLTSDAVSWWARALKLTCGAAPDDLETLPTVLKAAPSSPRAQRLLSTTLVSLSTFYAKSGQLKQAQALEEAALTMFESVPPPAPLTSASPPHMLHALYLLQRSSVISVHLAEVLHARSQPLDSSIQYLTSAAETSERVARILTGNPLENRSDSPISVQDAALVSVFTSSRSMKKPAKALLRDAQRTCAEAWNLIGILNEHQKKNPKTALQCYERAVHWAGTVKGNSDAMQPRDGMLESEWQMIWNNYIRAKRKVEVKSL